MNSASNFRDTFPELYVVPPVGVPPTQDVNPPRERASGFTVEPPSERPPVGFVSKHNIDATPTLDGMIFPVDDKTLPTYQTVQASSMLNINAAIGDLRPLLERETITDEQGREITYQFDPISGLFLHQGYGVNSVVKPRHYEKVIDRGDHFLPPEVTNTGSATYAPTPTGAFYMPRLQPAPLSLH